MKAIVSTKHGGPDVLQLKEVNMPTPKTHEILIKIHAATVTRGDVMLRKLHPLVVLLMRFFGVRRKKVPGHEFAGEIVAVGQAVTRFKIGERVFGTTTGLSVGANAEYLCMPETGMLTTMPASTSYEAAAALPVGGMTALYLLQKGNVQPAQKMLVYGASGSVGTFAVQLARHLFGAEVTGVCSTKNVEFVKSLGAEQVVDYIKEDVTQHGPIYDIVFDAVGKLSESQRKSLLKEKGAFLTIQTSTSEKTENLEMLKTLVETGKLKAVIDRRYPLAQVAEAHRYVETGRKLGNVVIQIAS